jgi:hypothetical protein
VSERLSVGDWLELPGGHVGIVKAVLLSATGEEFYDVQFDDQCRICLKASLIRWSSSSAD